MDASFSPAGSPEKISLGLAEGGSQARETGWSYGMVFLTLYAPPACQKPGDWQGNGQALRKLRDREIGLGDGGRLLRAPGSN